MRNRNSLYHGVAWLLACLVLTRGSVVAAEPQKIRLERIMGEIQRAITYRAQAELLDRLSLDAQERTEVAKWALRSECTRTRAFGAVLAIGVANDDDRAALLNQANGDSESFVARVAILGKILSAVPITSDERKLIARGKDVVARAAVALQAGEFRELQEFALDESPVVRACAARRVTAIHDEIVSGNQPVLPEEDGASEAILDVVLMDRNMLVRGNALLSARAVEYFPKGTVRGLVADGSPLVDIIELFGGGQEEQGLRKNFGLGEMPDWDLSLLGMIVVRQIPFNPGSSERILLNDRARLCAQDATSRCHETCFIVFSFTSSEIVMNTFHQLADRGAGMVAGHV